MRTFLILVLTFFAAALVASAAPSYPQLRDSVDPELQKRLEGSLPCMGLETAAEKENLCLALVDITDPETPHLAMINGDRMMYAASLPKIAILLGAFDRIEKGDMTLDAGTREELEQMIRYSSNHAATRMLNRVGKEYLADLLQSPRYRLYDPVWNGGLWVGKEYGKSPAWKRDPLHNLSHGATAFQVARYFYLLETGRLVSPEASREMKEILGDPAICHKFVKGLLKCQPLAKIYRKSGTWRQFHADAGIVEHDGRRYIAVALADSNAGSRWLSNLIVVFDGLICQPQTPPEELLQNAN